MRESRVPEPPPDVKLKNFIRNLLEVHARDDLTEGQWASPCSNKGGTVCAREVVVTEGKDKENENDNSLLTRVMV